MISILVPTRKRPEGVKRVIESARATAKNFRIYFYVDEDDTSQPILKHLDKGDVSYMVGPRIVLSNTWNKLARFAMETDPTTDIFMQGNDDIAFRTPGWDAIVEDEFAKSIDKILVVHGSDGSQGHDSSVGKFAPHPFVHRRWIETLGYFTPPYFSSDFGDTWINELANALERRKYVPFVIEHLHYIFGKADTDSTTKERLDRHSSDRVEQLYADLQPLRELDIEKLKAVCQ